MTDLEDNHITKILVNDDIKSIDDSYFSITADWIDNVL